MCQIKAVIAIKMQVKVNAPSLSVIHVLGLVYVHIQQCHSVQSDPKAQGSDCFKHSNSIFSVCCAHYRG